MRRLMARKCDRKPGRLLLVLFDGARKPSCASQAIHHDANQYNPIDPSVLPWQHIARSYVQLGLAVVTQHSLESFV